VRTALGAIYAKRSQLQPPVYNINEQFSPNVHLPWSWSFETFYTSVVVLFNDYIHIVIDGLTSIVSVPAGGRYTDAIFDKAREIGFS
jgi:hypothetical protein